LFETSLAWVKILVTKLPGAMIINELIIKL